MFSLGLVICAVFNRGRPIIQSGNVPANYIKQLEAVSGWDSGNADRLSLHRGHLLLVTLKFFYVGIHLNEADSFFKKYRNSGENFVFEETV